MTDALHSVPQLGAGLHRHWRLYIIEGVLLVILGSAAILAPVLASVAVAVFLGWLFLIGGFVGLVITIAGRAAPGFWWSLLSSIVTIVAGGLLVGWPIGGTISLTLVLVAFLAADGVLMILFALDHRRGLSKNWGWLLVNGILDVGLAGLILWALPASALWALGLIVGIDLWFGGWSLISMALAARKPA